MLNPQNLFEMGQKARSTLAPFLTPTPLVRSPFLSEWIRTHFPEHPGVFFKLETLQPTGAFKVRCAFYGILAHLAEAQNRGVVTTSSGNFAQAVAYAAKTLNVQATIVMTNDTAPIKVERTRALGARVVFCGLTFESRFEKVAEIQAQTNALLLHGFDSAETIAGNSTLGFEIREQLPGSFNLLCPVSGGGLLSGISVALRDDSTFNFEGSILGIQPSAGGAMAKSIFENKRVNVGKIHTLADALVASEPGHNTLPLLKERASGWILVDEPQILTGALHCLMQERLVVEPGGSIGVAALLGSPEIVFDRLKHPSLRLVIVLTGGNFDLKSLIAKEQ